MKSNVFLVIGLAPVGLYLMQELSKNKNNVVYGIGRSGDFGQHSKFGIKYEANNQSELVDKINKISKNNINIIITNSFYLEMFVNELSYMYNEHNIIGPDHALTKKLIAKKEAEKILSDYGLKFPDSILLKDYNNEFKYPVIVKWNSSPFSVDNRVGLLKTKIIYSDEELYEYTYNLQEGIVSKLIVQKYLPHADYNEFGYGAYYINGKKTMDVIFKQVRQYPQGISTYAVEINDSHKNVVIDKFDKFANINKLNGFLQFDYLEHKTDKEDVFLLDVNPRTWGSSKILTKKYKNFHQLMVDQEITPIISKRKARFTKFYQDLISLVILLINFRIFKFLKGLSSLFTWNKAYDVFSFKDVRPFFIGIPKKIFKRSN